ncbi:MAG: DUF4363 family protein [Clostridia bacterium]|nr:DUF4363 family protein [Clostridia bacterium]
MSRKILIIVLAFAFLMMLSIIEQRLVSHLAHAALRETAAITDEIRAHQLGSAMKKAHALDQAWDREARKLELLVDHSSTDEVRYALSRLLAALEGEDRASALIYAGELEGAIEHVHERQALTPENIL